MSNWATRCNACGTSFRVSEDQLQVSDGYVRCGRCDAVFNARNSLFDLEAGSSAPMPLAPAPSPPASQAEIPAPAVASAPAVDVDAREPTWSEPTSLDEGRTEPSWVETAAETPPPAETNEAEANARLRDLLGIEPGAAPHPGLSAEAAPWSSLARERPSSKPARRLGATLAGVCSGLMILALPMQWAWIERDALRARWPQLDGMLNTHWPALGAEGWRHLEGLSVSASSLQATPQGKAYRLELVLHNRADHGLAAPWLDLSLSDAQGQLLLRRAVAPHELGNTKALRPGEQRRLQAVFQLSNGTARVAGYELGLFHP